MADNKKQKHRCPALPEGLSKITPEGWNGEDVDKAKAMWFAWLRIVSRQQPLARKTH